MSVVMIMLDLFIGYDLKIPHKHISTQNLRIMKMDFSVKFLCFPVFKILKCLNERKNSIFLMWSHIFGPHYKAVRHVELMCAISFLWADLSSNWCMI